MTTRSPRSTKFSESVASMNLNATTMSPKVDTPSEESVNIRVVVRVRPFNPREIDIHTRKVEGKPEWEQYPIRSVVEFSGTSCVFLDSEHDWIEKERFVFDSCLWSIPDEMQTSDNPYASQETLFKDFGETILTQAWKGFNTCFLAYGQTGSGKTYSMMGQPIDTLTEKADPGLIPRLCKTLFEQVYAAEKNAEKDHESYVRKFRVTVQYMEIYNEMVKDLLWPLSELTPEAQAKINPDNLKIRNNPVTGVFVEHLTSIIVKDWKEMLSLIELGNNSRATAATSMNDRSSRSHAVFKIMLTQVTTYIPKKQFEKPTEHIRESQINLVDLAGSERNKKSNATGDRLKEAASINKSLSTLKNVIDALVENCTTRGPKKRIPYRDSHLTSILMDSLGGNSKTFMLVTVSPHEDNAEETLQSLKYGAKARSIVSVVRVNENAAGRMILDLEDEIKELKDKLEDLEKEGQSSEAVEDLEAQIAQHEETRRKLQSQQNEQKEVIKQLKIMVEKEAERKRKSFAALVSGIDLEMQKSEQAEEEESLRRKVSNLSRDINYVLDRKCETEAEIDFVMQKIDELKEKRTAMEQEVDALAKKQTKMESTRWELQKKIDECKHLLRKTSNDRIGALLKARLEASRARLMLQRKKQDRISSNKEEADILKQKMKRQNEDLNFENRMKQQDLEAERDKVRSELKSLKAELDRVEGERARQIETLENRVETLQNENRKRREALAVRVSAVSNSWDKRYSSMVCTMERQYSELMDESKKRHREEELKEEEKVQEVHRKHAEAIRALEGQWKARVEAARVKAVKDFTDAKSRWEKQLVDRRRIMMGLRHRLREVDEKEKAFCAFQIKIAAILDSFPKPNNKSSPVLAQLYKLIELYHGQYEEDRPNMRHLHSLLTHDVNANRCDNPPILGIAALPLPPPTSVITGQPIEGMVPAQEAAAATVQAAAAAKEQPLPQVQDDTLRRKSASLVQNRTTAAASAGCTSSAAPASSVATYGLNTSNTESTRNIKDTIISPPTQVQRRSLTPVRSTLFFSSRLRAQSPARQL